MTSLITTIVGREQLGWHKRVFVLQSPGLTVLSKSYHVYLFTSFLVSSLNVCHISVKGCAFYLRIWKF